MAKLKTALLFLLQSATVGLAAAFVVVYLFPGLLDESRRPGGGSPASFASAVTSTAPSVSPVASPVSSTVATLTSELDHVTSMPDIEAPVSSSAMKKSGRFAGSSK